MSALCQLSKRAKQLRGAADDFRIQQLRALVDAARRHAGEATGRFRDVSQRTAELFSGLGEPLISLDFGEHRWMADQREEAYTDWLHWILLQCTSADVLRVLGEDEVQFASVSADSVFKITRERPVLHGHPGATGRLDLEIDLGGVGLVIVEVKLTDAESADTGKNLGYYHSVESESRAQLRKYRLLVIDAEKQDYAGFTPLLWENVCLQLRVVAAGLGRHRHLLRAAAILTFVAAVEQNVLKLRPILGASTDTVCASLSLPRITDYLNRFLEMSDAHHEH